MSGTEEDYKWTKSDCFRDAVDRCDLKTAARLCQRDTYLCNEGIEYVVQEQSLRFTVDFMNEIKQENKFVLARLFHTKSRRVIEAVLKEVKFHETEVYYAVRTCRVIRTPEYFLVLLDKILEPKDQKEAIERGVERLFYNGRTRYIEGLLDALEGKVIGGELARDIAIRQIFKVALYRERNFWAKRFYNHPAVTSKSYAVAVGAGLCEKDKSKCGWVWKAADLDDLKKARKTFSQRMHQRSTTRSSISSCSRLNLGEPDTALGRESLSTTLMTIQ